MRTLPPKAKITAEVWSGRMRPKLVQGRPRLSSGKESSSAAQSPTVKPAIPQKIEISVANLIGP